MEGLSPEDAHLPWLRRLGDELREHKDWQILSAKEMESRIRELYPGADTSHYVTALKIETRRGEAAAVILNPSIPSKSGQEDATLSEAEARAQSYGNLKAVGEAMSVAVEELASRNDREVIASMIDCRDRQDRAGESQREAARMEQMYQELRRMATTMSETEDRRKTDRLTLILTLTLIGGETKDGSRARVSPR